MLFVIVSFFIRDLVDLDSVVCLVSLPWVVNNYTVFSHIILPSMLMGY